MDRRILTLQDSSFIKFKQFQETGAAEDLNEAIQKLQQAMRIVATADDPRMLEMGNDLCNHLQRRFMLLGDLNDLQKATDLMKQVVTDTPPQDDQKRPIRLSNLGSKLALLFKQTSNEKDIEEAISVTEEAIRLTPDGHPSQPGRLMNLGSHLGWLADKTKDAAQADKAVEYLLQARKIMLRSNDPMLGSVSAKLGENYDLLFERRERAEDLESGIKYTKEAVERTLDGDQELPGRLSNLGNLLGRRFERAMAKEDLHEMIEACSKAVSTTPRRNPALAGRLNNLGNAFRISFDQTGNGDDLKIAITKTLEAVASPGISHRDHVGALSNLGLMLGTRFQRTYRMEDLNGAIEYLQKAEKLSAAGDDRPGILHNLSHQLHSRFERTGNVQDVKEATQKMLGALLLYPNGDPGVAGSQTSLSCQLLSWFEISKDLADLKEAERISENAVKATPNDHSHLYARLCNHGNVLGKLFEVERDGKMLERATETLNRAIELMPKDHPDLARLYYNLGRILGLSTESSPQAAVAYMKAWECRNGGPFDRVRPARQAIEIFARQKRWDEASAIASEAVEVLPTLNIGSLNRDDQQQVVSSFADLAANACALCLQVGGEGSDAHALELLEVGRGVIIGTRIDVSKLESSHPEKAAEYSGLVVEVNMPIRDVMDGDEQVRSTRRRVAAAQRLEACVREIRELPGHRRFQLGLGPEEMKLVAVDGPIIFINITDIRSDALIITKSAIRIVKLSEQTASEADSWLHKDLTRPRRNETLEDYGQRNKAYRKFLVWLWRTCVEPVYGALKSSQELQTQGLTRVWWIGSSLGNFMPFHAAGEHSKGSTENTFSWAISSYAVTLKTLIHARQGALQAMSKIPSQRRLLMVSMPTTPGQSSLPFVPEECRAVHEAVQGSISVKSLIQPSAQGVLSQVKGHDMVHFACHGGIDSANPSHNFLILQRDDSLLSEQDKLTVRQISEAKSETGLLAYLSACWTAEQRAVNLADEALHLASAFQIAGFPHVIASRWPVKDDISVKVAKGFYDKITKSYCREARNEVFAVALHQTILELHSNLRSRPLDWAQYIHLGV
jgi:tetratricopeptide (TPR) repeat protein